jgi:hypothetical protein
MKEIPNEITLCYLSCVLMPNGEILSNGKSIGMFSDLGKYLSPIHMQKSIVNVLVPKDKRKKRSPGAWRFK